MLGSGKVITTIAVNDMENAEVFYGDILGLKKLGKNSAGTLFESGGGTIGLYQSTTAGTGQSTSAWWTVDDVAGTVERLQSLGVDFDTNYDMPYATRKGEIYLLGDTQKAAWFKDPDGNILGFGNF